jgi:proline-specific peptidase
MTSLPTKEGHAVFMHPSLPADTECQTWYKVLGDLSSNKRPIVVLHGGPGSTHDSLTVAFDPYASKYDTPVVYYDQLGNGKSTHLRQKRGDEAFWTPELFVAELDNLVRHLGIRENFDLFGHSWGAKLAAKYAASPLSAGSGLYKIILASGACTQKDMNRATQILIKQLPQDVQDTINKYSKEKNFDAPEYKGALLGFFKKHLCRLDPWPPVIFETVKALAADDTVYSTMLGPDGLNPTGSLRGKDWHVYSPK